MRVFFRFDRGRAAVELMYGPFIWLGAVIVVAVIFATSREPGRARRHSRQKS